MLVGAQSFSSLLLISANIVWGALPFTNLIVAVITSQIIRAITTTGFSDE